MKAVQRRQATPPAAPLWSGPEEDGITQSLLSRWIVCRERFRLLVVEGLRPADAFNHRIQYGALWHTCEQAIAGDQPWIEALFAHSKRLQARYPFQQPDVVHWTYVCQMQFAAYLDHWAKHRDEASRQSVAQELVFDTPYPLPSSRTVRLRGRYDSLELLGRGRNRQLWLQDHKTKGDLDEQQLRKQLHFDLQTMFYLSALGRSAYAKRHGPPAGVRYNVVRRPLSGGRHSIRKLKPTRANPAGESDAEYYQRLRGLIAGEPEYFFMRFKAVVTPDDCQRFEASFLTPVLEELCDWWEWVSHAPPDDPWTRSNGFNNAVHWRTPFGIYNVLAEGGSSDLDEYLATGGTAGLERATTLFEELQDDG